MVLFVPMKNDILEDEMKFGVEIEVTGKSITRTAEHLKHFNIDATTPGYTHSVSSTWKVVPDGSVTRGCEVVSPVLDAANGGIDDLARIASALMSSPDGSNLTSSGSCGFHVHVDARDLKIDDIKNIVRRYMRFEDEIDAFMAPSRRGDLNTFCKSNKELMNEYRYIRDSFESAQTTVQLACALRTRYLKVNLESLRRHGTIEFRQHCGTVNRNRIVNWTRFILEFVAASISQTSTATVQTSCVDAPRGKLGRALQMMLAGPMTRERIGREMGWDDRAVRAAIYRLRKRGHQIIRTSTTTLHMPDDFSAEYTRISYYRAVAETAVTTQTRTANVDDTLFRGISRDLVDYYNAWKERYARRDANRELRRVNEILHTASNYFDQAEQAVQARRVELFRSGGAVQARRISR